jgi:hypothetical protein
VQARRLTVSSCRRRWNRLGSTCRRWVADVLPHHNVAVLVSLEAASSVEALNSGIKPAC